MTKRREDRQHWLEARTAVAEELLRAYAAAPKSSLEHLRSSIQAENRLFEAALNHLVATGRLPRDVLPKSQHAIAEENRERLVTHLASNGGCATDTDRLRSVLNIADPQQVKSMIESLVDRNRIIATSERVFLQPDGACLSAALEEISTPRFSISDVTRTEAVGRYAQRAGLPVDQVAPIVARGLERQSRIVSVGEGEYRSRTTVAAAVRRIRAAFREYRPYGTDELVAAAKLTNRHFGTFLLISRETAACARVETRPSSRPHRFPAAAGLAGSAALRRGASMFSMTNRSVQNADRGSRRSTAALRKRVLCGSSG
jgi:hypothetical protein